VKTAIDSSVLLPRTADICAGIFQIWSCFIPPGDSPPTRMVVIIDHARKGVRFSWICWGHIPFD
jgi:hypothetical protein